MDNEGEENEEIVETCLLTCDQQVPNTNPCKSSNFKCPPKIPDNFLNSSNNCLQILEIEELFGSNPNDGKTLDRKLKLRIVQSSDKTNEMKFIISNERECITLEDFNRDQRILPQSNDS